MGNVASAGLAPGPPALTAVGGVADDASFAELCEGAFPRVYAFVRAQVASRAVAEEIVARVFLKACEHRQALPAGEQGVFWLFRAAKTTLIDYWRVEGRREQAKVAVDELALRPGVQADPETAHLRRERVAGCLRLLDRLDEPDRTILLLKFAGQRTNREIAAILGTSAGAVAMRLLRAVRWLRERMREARL